MQVIHFTEGATDPLDEIASHGAGFVQLAEGMGECHLGRLHLDSGGNLPRRSIAQDCALLGVQGSITLIDDSGFRLEKSRGVGVALKANEYFTLESDAGGIMMLIRCQQLKAHEGGIPEV